jgi:hypothetical protein
LRSTPLHEGIDIQYIDNEVDDALRDALGKRFCGVSETSAGQAQPVAWVHGFQYWSRKIARIILRG